MLNRWLLIGVLVLSCTSLYSQETLRYDSGYSWRGYDGTTVAPLCPNKLCTNYNMVGSLNSSYREFAGWKGTNANSASAFLNFRVIFPPGYNKKDKTKKYPMILMLHGAGESGRIWQGRFNYSTSQPEFDNNSNSLKHGGTEHRDAVNRAATNARAFPGIVVFPQASYSGSWGDWNGGQLSQNQEFIIGFIELLIADYNVDINRIAIQGLSNGAKGTWDTSIKRPDLFAAMQAFSGVPNDVDIAVDSLLTMPIRLYQGGTDTNPSPGGAQTTINAFLAEGGNPQYFFYPTLGHNTWTTAFAMNDFFSWVLQQDKRKVYVFGGSTELCVGATKKLGFSAGMKAYQWTLNGTPISGANKRYLTLNQVGTYVCRFQRPNDNTWYESFPVNITLRGASSVNPVLTVSGSLIAPYTNDQGDGIGSVGQTRTILNAPAGYSEYFWYKNNVLLGSSTTNTRTISQQSGQLSDAGVYHVVVREPSGCLSNPSNSLTMVYNPNALKANNTSGPWHTNPIGAFSGRPGVALVPDNGGIRITWSDSFTNEEYFEIWRYRRGENGYPGTQANYQMIATTAANSTSYVDNVGLRPNAQYFYYVRAVGLNDGRFSQVSLTITNSDDTQPPTAPADLEINTITSNSINISWSASRDNDVVYSYEMFLGDSLVATLRADTIAGGDLTDGNPAPPTTYTFRNLDPGVTYLLNVRASDFRGNRSPFPSALVGTTRLNPNGIAFKYYEGTAFSGNLPNFNNYTPVSTGTLPNISIASRRVSTNFGFLFEGFIEILEPGPHVFGTRSDDGSKLFVNNVYVVNNDGGHGAQTRNGTYNFPAPGLYPIRLEYGQGTGGFELSWDYDTPSETLQPIPSSRLYLSPVTVTNYYSKATGSLNDLSTWGRNTDGSGAAPTSFTANYQFFNLRNRTSASVDDALTISGISSRLIVEQNVTLTLNARLNAKVYANANSSIIVAASPMPDFTVLDPTSTVTFNVAGNVPNAVYGNVIFNATSPDMFLPASNIVVKGNLQVNNDVKFKGTTTNASIMTVEGNLTFSGTAGTPANAAERFSLYFAGRKNHILSSSSDLDLYALEVENEGSVEVQINKTGTKTLRIGTTAGSGGLMLRSGSRLVLNDAELQVSGSYGVNPGNEGGLISINGGSIQVTSSATTPSALSFDAAGNVLRNLSLAMGATGRMNLLNNCEITEVVTVTSGILSVNNLKLRSNASGTARIASLLNGARVEGNVQFQRFMEGEGAIYRYVSSPIKNFTVANLQQYVPVTGSFTGATVIPNTVASMYFYQNNAYRAFPPTGGTNQDTLRTGLGYAMYVREAVNPTTWEATGQMNQGNIAFTLSPGTNSSNDGWNLLGNPYPAPIRWTDGNTGGWTSSGIAPTVYVRENFASGFRWQVFRTGITTGNLGASEQILTNGVIAPGQAFWVQATTATPSLTITENAKFTTTGGSFFREDEPMRAMTILVSNGTLEDVTYLVPDPKANNNFVKEEDAVKFGNSFFSIASRSADNIDVAINFFNAATCGKEVALNLANAAAGNYSMKFDGIEVFNGPVTLVDKFTGTTTQVANGSVYNFVVTSDAGSRGANRFAIRSSAVIQTNIDLAGSEPCGTGSFVRVLNPQNSTSYQVIRNGQVLSDKLMSSGGQELLLPLYAGALSTGNHEVQVRAGEEGCEVQLPSSVSLNVLPEIRKDISYQVSDPCASTASVVLENAQPQISYQLFLNGAPASAKLLSTGSSLALPVLPTVQSPWGGTDSYELRASYAGGCDGIVVASNVEVTSRPDFKKSLAISKTGECENNTSIIVQAPQDLFSYQVVNNNQVITESQMSDGYDLVFAVSDAITPGVHELNVRVERNGCSESLKQPITVFVDGGVRPAVEELNASLRSSMEGTSYQWYVDNEAISGANDRSWTPVRSGSYHIVVDNGFCSFASVPVSFTVTSLDPEATGNGVYPNPAEGLVTISLNEHQRVQQVRVLNLVGQVVHSENVSFSAPGGKAELNLGHLKAGTYIIAVGPHRFAVVKK